MTQAPSQAARLAPPAALLVACGALIFLMSPRQDPSEGMHLADAGTLPIMDNGRVKPLDSYARTTLMQISSRQTWRDSKDAEHEAIEWFFDVATGKGRKEAIKQAQEQPAFRITSPAIRDLLGLSNKANGVFALNDLGEKGLGILLQQGKQLLAVPPDQLNRDDVELLQMFKQMAAFAQGAEFATPHKVFRIENDKVLDLLMLERRPGKYRYSYGEILPREALLEQEARRADGVPEDQRSTFDNKVMEAARNVQRYLALATLSSESLCVVPPAEGDQGWKTFAEAGEKGAFADLLQDYQGGNVATFNKQVDDYRAQLQTQMPADAKRASFEAFFNEAEPFYQSTWMFFTVFLCACVSWIAWSEPLRRTALGLMVLTLVVHTAALLARMYLMNRPLVFITNLYSTAIFIGWVGAIFGVVIELIFRRGIGMAVGGILGFLTSIVAHNLATGDTLEQVVAVLDTNFWLATHVTIINSGYGATFVAGLVGVGIIIAGMFTTALDRGTFRMLGQILYGVLCFATLFSFVGTVLGGIWADQSWGRFWGWDPKENGALLIVLMNALILHARWAGLVQQRGMAVLAVLGNIIVIWSWFGVNMLGVGLHSYGFIPSTFYGMLVADGIHLVIAIVGAAVPLQYWRSYAAMQARRALPEPVQAAPRRKPRRGQGPSTAISPA